MRENEIDKDGNPLIEIVEVEALVSKFGFHPLRIQEHKNDIIDFLEELPDEFRSSVGGGRSFLNACNDEYGNQWGEHRNIEQLFALGIAINKVKFMIPRDMWPVMPGGVPYVVYIDEL